MLCFSACKEDMGKEYTYLPKTELHTDENSSGYHKEYKTIYEYDEKGNVIKKTEYTKGFLGIFNVRERQYDIEYAYNENGNISQELIHIEDFCTSLTDGHQIYDEGYNYIYNENQQLVKKVIINSSDYVDARCGYEYKYDERGNLEKEYKYYDDGTKELEYENNYDSKNALIKKHHIINSGELRWIGEETDYTYDTDGNLVCSKTDYYEYTGEKSHYVEVNYHYDELNRLIKEESTIFNIDGEIVSTDINEYKDFSKINSGS